RSRHLHSFPTRRSSDLQVPALGNEIRDRMGMGHGGDILFYNGPRIQLGGHIMAGGPYDFHTPFKGGMIGLGPHKGGKEGMVDVEDRKSTRLNSSHVKIS